jgi:hypothetical protein
VGITHLAVLEKPKENVIWMKYPKLYRLSVAASITAMLGGGYYALGKQYEREKERCNGDYKVMEIAPGTSRGICFERRIQKEFK